MRSFFARLPFAVLAVCLSTVSALHAEEPHLQLLDRANINSDPGFVTYRFTTTNDGKPSFVMAMTCRAGYYPAWITTGYQGKTTDRHLCLPVNSKLVEVVDRCDEKDECRLGYRLTVDDYPVSLDHYALISVQRLSGMPMCQPLQPLSDGETFDPQKVDCGIRHNGRLVMYQGAVKPLLPKKT